MAKWVCQIPKSRWFVGLKMMRLNIRVGCGNRRIILRYVCLSEEVIIPFFLIIFNFCKLKHLPFNLN